MNIAKMAEKEKFKTIPTPKSKAGEPPICVLCEKLIETESCLVSSERDGFYLHPICGNNIGVECV